MSVRASDVGADSPSPRIVAQASLSPAQTEGLSIVQRAALAGLASGKSIRDAAASAGVARWTLHRWLKNDPVFRAAYNAWRQELIDSTHARLLRTAEIAASVIQRQIAHGDGRLALALLDRLGLSKPGAAPPAGPTDPTLAGDQIALEREEEVQGLEHRATKLCVWGSLEHGPRHLRTVRSKAERNADEPAPQRAPPPSPIGSPDRGGDAPLTKNRGS